MAKRRIFLTGAGGTMGGVALKLFVEQSQNEPIDVVILDLPTKANQEKLLPYESEDHVSIIWGDLTNYEDVLRGVTGADYVLHAAAVIPPMADHDPDLALRVNVGAVKNIIQAIKSQQNADEIKFVNIGSVAETGDRLPPIHVGRIGDPLMPSAFDMYAATKVVAERLVAESGLRYWVSLRQTFILNEDIDPVPIMYHMPLNTCFEGISRMDAGRVLVNVTDPELPEDFWRRFYNIGGGPGMRSTYYHFLKASLEVSGLKLEGVLDRNWFALRNFHCHWFEDSHDLNDVLNFQTENLTDHFANLEKNTPLFNKIAARLTPKRITKNLVFKPTAHDAVDSPQYWLRNNPLRTQAFFVNEGTYKSIPDWDVTLPDTPQRDAYKRLDHGYDETKPVSELDIEDMRQAAGFRGGRCLSTQMVKGDLFGKLAWECCFGHRFEMTPNTVLKGGHWCPECAPPGWNYAEEAKYNPYLAQVWYTHHQPDEKAEYPIDCIYDLTM